MTTSWAATSYWVGKSAKTKKRLRNKPRIRGDDLASIEVLMKNHLFVHQSTSGREKELRKAYSDVVPVLEETGSSLFFCDPIGFDILAPTEYHANKVREAFGWKTLREVEPGRYTTNDDVW
jgi:hypothetical protein